jgi:hypothetical protein
MEGFHPLFTHGPIVLAMFKHLAPIGQWNLIRCNRFLWNNFSARFKRELDQRILEELQLYLGSALGHYLHGLMAGPNAALMLTGDFLLQVLHGERWLHKDTYVIDLIAPGYHPLPFIGHVFTHNIDAARAEMDQVIDGFDITVTNKSKMYMDYMGSYADGRAIVKYDDFCGGQRLTIRIPGGSGTRWLVDRGDLDFTKNMYWKGKLYMFHTDTVTHRTSLLDSCSYFKNRFFQLFTASEPRFLGEHVHRLAELIAETVNLYRLRGFAIRITNTAAPVSVHVKRKVEYARKRVKTAESTDKFIDSLWGEIWRTSPLSLE